MIKLYLSNKQNETVFVWDADDICKLRRCHRIVGSLIGVHPYKPNQVKRRHVPLKLMPEEVKLLLDKGYAKLYQSPAQSPGEDVIKTFEEMRSKLCDEQVVLSKEHRKQEILEKCKNPDIAQMKSDQVKEIPKEDTYFQIFTEYPWKKDQEVEKTPKFPSTPEEKVRYAAYKDLWEKEYYVTCGSKFGGDFLVYAGDPYMFHSLYVVVCLPAARKIQGFDIITYGRLGNQVKKTVALAFLNEHQKIEYLSLSYCPENK